MLWTKQLQETRHVEIQFVVWGQLPYQQFNHPDNIDCVYFHFILHEDIIYISKLSNLNYHQILFLK